MLNLSPKQRCGRTCARFGRGEDQLDLQGYHRVRSRLVFLRTATINQIRAFLIEQGIAITAGTRALRKSLFYILKNRGTERSPRVADLIIGLYEDWLRLDEPIETIYFRSGRLCRNHRLRNLFMVTGLGIPISTTYTIAGVIMGVEPRVGLQLFVGRLHIES